MAHALNSAVHILCKEACLEQREYLIGAKLHICYTDMDL